jgi:ketosteroid isomerase-like protein
MTNKIVLTVVCALLSFTAINAQNSNSSTTARPRSTNSNKSTQATDTTKPATTTTAPQATQTKPAVTTTPTKPAGGATATGADAVKAAFDKLIDGIQHADVKTVTDVYLNSPRLVLFNNNGSVTKGWDQMRKNRESSYPELKNVKLEIKDRAITMLGRDGAVVTCLWTQSQVYKGTPETASGRMTLVFRRIGKDWKAVHLHTSPDAPNPSTVMPSEQAPAAKPSPTPQ